MTFLVWVYTFQDFAQTQQNFARSHDRETVTFKNSAIIISTFCMEKPSLEEKNLTQKPYLLQKDIYQWLFHGEFWKDNTKGFFNLVLKIAL